jgi:hypothetical protein
MNRRALLKSALCAGLPVPAPAAHPPRIFDPREDGAAGDGKTKDTAAIQNAIDRCSGSGGGIVYLAPGTYLSGTLVLKSNVTLYLEAGAILLGSTDLADYIPQLGPKPHADANDKHLLFARKAENISICGEGVIDGQGQAFWTPSGRKRPDADELWADVATWYWKPLPRPSPMLELAECKNVRIEDVTLRNSPGWTLRPIACESVFISRIRIRNPVYGPNTDGIDVTCSQNVFISDCDISTGDDAICLKSENPYGEILVSRNITVSNCALTGCCNGFKIGTATHGGFENIAFSNSVVFNGPVAFDERIIAGVAVEMVDGGWIDGVMVSNIRMQNVRTPIFIRFGNRAKQDLSRSQSYLRGVMISGVRATGAILTSSITGLPEKPVADVTLRHIRVFSQEEGKADWSQRVIPERPEAYPEARMFGRLPASGLYCRHVQDLLLDDVRVESQTSDPRPLLVCEDVSDLEIDAVAGRSNSRLAALLDLRQVRNAFIRNSSAPASTAAFLRVSGVDSSGIVLAANNLRRAEKPVELDPAAPQNAVSFA